MKAVVMLFICLVAVRLNPWAAGAVRITCIWSRHPSPACKGANRTSLLGSSLAHPTTVAPSFEKYSTYPDSKLHEFDIDCKKPILLPSAPVLSLASLPHHYHWLGDTGLEILLILFLGLL